MVSLLISLLILGLIIWLVMWIIGLLPIPAPFKQIVYIVLGVLVLIYLLEMLTGGGLGLRGLSLR